MPRSIWKGAISFGLVHIPVGLVSATSSQGVDFDWLDKRSMDPVGYKRINKVTGKEITSENIVKGVQFEKGRYVVLSEEEIRTAHPQSTQTIDIFTFVEREQIPLQNIDTPYYLSPEKRGEKVYALLREALRGSGRVALARVVLHTRQYLAALMPLEDALVLVKLRWPAEVRSLAILELGSAVSKPDLAKAELDMAKRLIEDMSGDWQPDDYRDTFQEKIMELVEEKASAGKITHVEGVEAGEARRSADVIDLTELLKRSLSGKRGESAKADTDDTASTPKEKPAPRKKTGKTARSK
ncbi:MULTISPECIES: Ku protein [Pseudomonas]|jgi:DNA end-binding protein Ku|uniref:Non-homologous end joining protein Ku n=1 Tax=Serpens gallinarum TaxID=2763075 RepID=A0ABR8TN74_9PSED|nr:MULTISPECIES: Ku protein [Pseudomonas]MBD7977222.1 Ku protein [Serpens gallinarum]MBF0674152.1 Ku protein [Pseudomonas sp.]